MKRSLIILFIICSLFNKLYGQTAHAAIDSLIKYRVITTKERKVIDNELRADDTISYRLVILGGLENIMMQKTFHLNPHKIGILYSYSYRVDHPDKNKQDSTNKSLRLLLEKINKAGLLTERVYNYTLTGIDSNHYFADMQLIGHLAEISYRLERLSPQKLLPVAEQFHQYGIISDSSFSRLEQDIRNGKIKSTLQLNSYFKLGRELDLDKYPDDPNVWLEQVYRDISSILPGLAFTNFNYTTSPYAGLYGSPETQYTASLTCNGHVYKHKNIILDFQKRNGKVRPIDFIVLDFERIFNKVLADEQSPYRLHSLMFGFEGTEGDNLQHPSFIALQEKQTEVFDNNQCMHYVTASFENYDNTLTSSKIDSAITGWTNMGLFTHLSAAEISKAIDDVEADNWFSLNSLLADFPRVIYPVDSGFMSPEPPYADLLKKFAIISHGAFDPTKIVQIKIKTGIKLQYISGGKIHYHTFLTANGWLDDGFPAFVEHLGEENNLPGKFYSLPYENAIIYLTRQQYDFAVEHKILDLK